MVRTSSLSWDVSDQMVLNGRFPDRLAGAVNPPINFSKASSKLYVMTNLEFFASSPNFPKYGCFSIGSVPSYKHSRKTVFHLALASSLLNRSSLNLVVDI